jgi:peptide subunit release factor RF-3
VKLARDSRGQLVVLFPSQWSAEYFAKERPQFKLYNVSPHQVGAGTVSAAAS